jgi:hypothetical protein
MPTHLVNLMSSTESDYETNQMKVVTKFIIEMSISTWKYYICMVIKWWWTCNNKNNKVSLCLDANTEVPKRPPY